MENPTTSEEIPSDPSKKDNIDPGSFSDTEMMTRARPLVPLPSAGNDNFHFRCKSLSSGKEEGSANKTKNRKTGRKRNKKKRVRSRSKSWNKESSSKESLLASPLICSQQVCFSTFPLKKSISFSLLYIVLLLSKLKKCKQLLYISQCTKSLLTKNLLFLTVEERMINSLLLS